MQRCASRDRVHVGLRDEPLVSPHHLSDRGHRESLSDRQHRDDLDG